MGFGLVEEHRLFQSLCVGADDLVLLEGWLEDVI